MEHLLVEGSPGVPSGPCDILSTPAKCCSHPQAASTPAGTLKERHGQKAARPSRLRSVANSWDDAAFAPGTPGQEAGGAAAPADSPTRAWTGPPSPCVDADTADPAAAAAGEGAAEEGEDDHALPIARRVLAVEDKVRQVLFALQVQVDGPPTPPQPQSDAQQEEQGRALDKLSSREMGEMVDWLVQAVSSVRTTVQERGLTWSGLREAGRPRMSLEEMRTTMERVRSCGRPQQAEE